MHAGLGSPGCSASGDQVTPPSVLIAVLRFAAPADLQHPGVEARQCRECQAHRAGG